MRVYVGAVCLGWMCCITSAQITWTESVWQTLGSWLVPEDPDSRVSRPGAKETVDILWGLPDREATVGEVFQMTVPNNAFSGNVQNYTVTQVDSTTLPRWLYFNATSNTLYGVPSMVDLGRTLLEVTAYGATVKGFHSKVSLTPSAITSFVINVHSNSLKHPAWNVPLLERETQRLDKIYQEKQRDMCNWNENIIRASLVLDATVENMDPQTRVNLLKKAAAFLQKDIHAFRLTETHSRVITQLMDTTVLMAGPGNAAIRTRNPGVELSWIISCGEANNVDDISHVLSHNVQNGRISTELGYDVIGWHLTETQPPKHIRKVRQKRQIQLRTPLNTPTLHPVASPVHTSSSISLTASPVTAQAGSETEVIHTESSAIEPTATSASLPHPSTMSIPPVIPSTLTPSINSLLVTSSMISQVTSAQSVSVSTPLESSSISSPIIDLSSSFSIETSPTGLFVPETSYGSLSSSTSMLSSSEPSLISTVFSSQTHSIPNEFVPMTTAHSSEQPENALTAAPPVGMSSSVEVSGILSVVSMTPSLPSQVLFTSSSEVSITELTSVTSSEILTSTDHESMFSAMATSMPAFTASVSMSEMYTVTPAAVVTTTSSARITEPVTAITELFPNVTAVTAMTGNVTSALNDTTLQSVSTVFTPLETSPGQSVSFSNLTIVPGSSPATPLPYGNQTGLSSNVTAGQPGAVTLSYGITSTHFYNESTLAEISIPAEVPNATTTVVYNYTIQEHTEKLSSATLNFDNSSVVETGVPTSAPSTTAVTVLTTPGSSNQSELLANATSNLVFTTAAPTVGIPPSSTGIPTTAAPVTGNSTTPLPSATTAAAVTHTTATHTVSALTTVTSAFSTSVPKPAPNTVTSVGVTLTTAPPSSLVHITEVRTTEVSSTTSVVSTAEAATATSVVPTTEVSASSAVPTLGAPATTSALPTSEGLVATSAVPTSVAPATVSIIPTSGPPATTSVPTTEVPASFAGATSESPTSVIPMSEAPTTTFVVPTTEVPATSAITTSESPTSVVPTPESPNTTSVVPTTEVPVTSEATTSESPTSVIPMSEAPTTTSVIRTTEVPPTSAFATSEYPTSVVPMSEAPTITSVIPTTEVPITSAGTTSESPTSVIPTSEAPTTTSVFPTTEVPITSVAITGSTSVIPTSEAPTTTSVFSTTEVPITSAGTTSESPTSVIPTTDVPVTSAVPTMESTISVVPTTEVHAMTSVIPTASSLTTALSSTAVTSKSILLLADSTSNSPIHTPTSSMSSVHGMTPTHHLSNRDVTTANPNQSPQLVNPMKQIVTYLGTYFDVLVPYDTFYDFEDGNTRSLLLSLLTSSGTPVPPDSFIQLNSETQTLYGLPLEKDVTGDTLVFMLVAEDGYGNRAIDNIEIIINTANVEEVSFIIKMVFDVNYEVFSLKRENLMVLMQKLASFYGDQSAEFYTVASVRNGSVLVEWTDNRVSKLTCQNDSISEIYGQLFSKGKINPAFRKKMLPEFPVTGLSYELLGICSEITTTATASTEFTAVAAAGSNAVLAIVLPIMLIIILIVIIFLVYWFCIRNRHKHSDYLTDHEKQVYANNRKPVLLESDLEMNDVPLKPRKPLILDEDVPSKAFDNPGYLDLDDGGRPPPPPYVLPMDDPISPGYGPVQATSTPKLYTPYEGDTPDNRPPPPPYRLPPLYLGTPGSSDI